MSLPVVEVLSRGEWEQRLPHRSVAVLSFANATWDEADLMGGQGWGLFTRLVMDDVSGTALPVWKRWLADRIATPEQHALALRWARRNPWVKAMPPTPWAAQEVVAFADRTARWDRVLVHCEYGKSRSAIAARALMARWTRQLVLAANIDPKGRNPRWARLLETAFASTPGGRA